MLITKMDVDQYNHVCKILQFKGITFMSFNFFFEYAHIDKYISTFFISWTYFHCVEADNRNGFFYVCCLMSNHAIKFRKLRSNFSYSNTFVKNIMCHFHRICESYLGIHREIDYLLLVKLNANLLCSQIFLWFRTKRNSAKSIYDTNCVFKEIILYSLSNKKNIICIVTLLIFQVTHL